MSWHLPCLPCSAQLEPWAPVYPQGRWRCTSTSCSRGSRAHSGQGHEAGLGREQAMGTVRGEGEPGDRGSRCEVRGSGQPWCGEVRVGALQKLQASLQATGPLGLGFEGKFDGHELGEWQGMR